MALRVLTRVTGAHTDFDVGVSFAQLYPSFTARMRKRYGHDVDAVNFDFTTSDPWAFDVWGAGHTDQGVSSSPEDRSVQRDFWLRYIGNSRSRLAEAFRRFFLPTAIYRTDPIPVVENKIPVADLRRLHDELPDDGPLTPQDRGALSRLRRILSGEFKNGINDIGEFADPSEEGPAAD
jgi:hypothetical protein